MPPEDEEILSFRSQICCFLAHKKTTTDFFFFFVVHFFAFFVFLWSECSSRGNPRYRGKGYCLWMRGDTLCVVTNFSLRSVTVNCLT